MSGEKDNEAIQQDLARQVVEEILGKPFDMDNVKIGVLAINYFSFVFSVEVLTSQGTQRVFVKIPKEDLRCDSKAILPISPTDRRLAEAETDSLRMLADHWQADDLKISWVRLLGEVPDFNAIVTDAVEGAEALHIFRRWDLRRRFGWSKDSERLRSAMARMGEALGRFHKSNARTLAFRVDQSIPKLERYCREIESSTQSPLLEEIIQAMHALAGMEFGAMEAPTLKGIDIRNVLMDDQDRLFLLDPGRLKRTCREADLARFIMTYRILYWGSRLFILGLRPYMEAEQAFLEAYYSSSAPPSLKLLSFFMIKEQLKHWHTALDSLRLLPWPLPVKRFVAATYINPYYKRQLTKELKELKR